MIEGSRPGSGSIPLTNGYGSGSRRPKNTWIRWIRIRIRNTAFQFRQQRHILKPCLSTCEGELHGDHRHAGLELLRDEPGPEPGARTLLHDGHDPQDQARPLRHRLPQHQEG
jgi:hypothetical protein